MKDLFSYIDFLFISVQQKTRTIVFKCSKCNYTINNNRQYFLNHIDHQHPELLQVKRSLSFY